MAKRKTNESVSVFWIFIILILGLFAASVMFFTEGEVAKLNTDSTLSALHQTGDDEMRVYTVSYKNGVFSPTNLRVRAGDTVRFKNDSLLPIRVISGDLSGFDSVGSIPRGGVFSYTFSSQGIFQYYNERDPSEAGTVIVR